jgi:hypothetical protein
LPQEAEDGGEGREADAAVAESRRVEPGLVELQAGRQQVRDALVQARHEESSDPGLNHR